MKIILIGFMGAGKTSVAKQLSTRLGLPRVEMDELVIKKTRAKSMDEVFKKGGEILLREMEVKIAKAYRKKGHLIISTGGGVVINKIVMDYLNENGGFVIFLEASFESIAKRLKLDASRPLFKDLLEAKKCYDFRLPLYRQYANFVIKTDDKTVAQIVDEIIYLL